MSDPNALLLVDDDPVFLERLALALRARGRRVKTAQVPEAALELWRSDVFSGAVIDLRLATSSGLRLIPLLKEAHPRARLIVLTGFGSIGTAMEAGRLGASEYFTKPVDVDRLFAALHESQTDRTPPDPQLPRVPTLESVEWEHIQRVLGDCGGNISRTARALGIDRRSLQRKLAKYPPSR